MRLAVARVVAELPERDGASCVDLVDTATAQLREDKDPDVRAVMRGGEEVEGQVLKRFRGKILFSCRF